MHRRRRRRGWRTCPRRAAAGGSRATRRTTQPRRHQTWTRCAWRSTGLSTTTCVRSKRAGRGCAHCAPTRRHADTSLPPHAALLRRTMTARWCSCAPAPTCQRSGRRRPTKTAQRRRTPWTGSLRCPTPRPLLRHKTSRSKGLRRSAATRGRPRTSFLTAAGQQRRATRQAPLGSWSQSRTAQQHLPLRRLSRRTTAVPWLGWRRSPTPAMLRGSCCGSSTARRQQGRNHRSPQLQRAPARTLRRRSTRQRCTLRQTAPLCQSPAQRRSQRLLPQESSRPACRGLPAPRAWWRWSPRWRPSHGRERRRAGRAAPVPRSGSRPIPTRRRPPPGSRQQLLAARRQRRRALAAARC